MATSSGDKPEPEDPILRELKKMANEGEETELPLEEEFEQKEPSSEDSNSSNDDSEPMTREELMAHLEANEARVEQMTDQVSSKVDRIGDKIDTKIGALDEKVEGLEKKQDMTRNVVIGVGTAILIVMTTLFIHALNRAETVEGRLYDHTQQHEQVEEEPPKPSNSN